jgi:hypothetical protein
MKPSWTLAVVIGLTAGSASAQPLIPPSREYSSTPPAALDKNYGLPTFGMPGSETPQQKTMAPKPEPQKRPDPFEGLTTHATPPTPKSSDTPDFFQQSATSDTSDVPNFFQAPADTGLPKASKSASGGETPLMTTTDGFTTDDSTSDKAASDGKPDD